jgi:hypothetical protein
MDGLEKFKNKKIKVIYRDVDANGKETRAIKVGKLIGSDSDFLYLITSDIYTAIPKNIVQRIEADVDEKS